MFSVDIVGIVYNTQSSQAQAAYILYRSSPEIQWMASFVDSIVQLSVEGSCWIIKGLGKNLTRDYEIFWLQHLPARNGVEWFLNKLSSAGEIAHLHKVPGLAGKSHSLMKYRAL